MISRPKKPPAASQLAHIAADLRPLAVRIADLTLDPRNARAHNERSIAGVADSIAKFGQVKPIVVNTRTGIVAAGNGTVRACQSLGKKYIAATLLELTDAEAQAYAILDNRSAELSAWDTQQLETTIAELQAAGIDAVDVGFTSDELQELIASTLPVSDDDADDEDDDEDDEDVGPQHVAEKFEVAIKCESEAEQRKVYETLREQFPANKLKMLTV